MKRTDEALEKVLEALRVAQPPDGLEERLLRFLRDKSAQELAAWPAWFVQRRFAWAAGAVACVALLSIFGLPLQSRHPREVSRQIMPARVEQAATEQPGVVATQLAEVRVPRHTRHATLQRVRDIPAHAMPLTEQEKLLLQVMQHGSSAEFVMLDRQKQQVQLAREQAQFQSFFGSAELKENINAEDANKVEEER